MSGYLIFNINVKDPEGYKEYLNKVTPIAVSFGGKYIVRAGEYQVLEGEWKFPRTVVIKFPSYDKALEFYNSEKYKPIRMIRHKNATSNAIIIKGT